MKTHPNRYFSVSLSRLAALAVPVVLLMLGLNFDLDWLGQRHVVAQTGHDDGSARRAAEPPEEVLKKSLLPLQPFERNFELIEGDDRGDVVTLSMKRSDFARAWDRRDDEPEQPQRWALKFDDYNTVYLERSKAGAIDLTRLDIRSENDGLVYEQPLTLVPARVKAGRTIEETSRVSLFDLRTGKVSSHGRVTHRIERISRSSFDTSAGKFEGYLLRISQKIDLPLATVEFELWLGCSPGKGIVYRRTSTTVEKLGLFGSTSVRTAVLTDSELTSD